MQKQIPHLNITQKLLIYLVLTTIIPLLAIGILSYNLSKTIIINEASQFTTELMTEKKIMMELIMKEIESLIANVSGNDDIKNSISIRSTNAYDRLSTHAKIGYILSGYINLKGLTAIDIFSVKGDHYHVGETLNIHDIRQDLVDRLLREAMQSKKTVFWAGVEESVNRSSLNRRVITAVKIFKSMDMTSLQEKAIGLLVVSYNVDVFYDYFNQESHNDQFYSVIDGYGRIVFHPDKNRIGQQMETSILGMLRGEKGQLMIRENGRDMLAIYDRTDRNGWRLIRFIPIKKLKKPIETIGKNMVWILMACVIMFTIFYHLLTKWVVTPIKGITKSFKQLREGAIDLSMRLKETSSDEIGQLVRWFNTFLESMTEKKKVEDALLEAKEKAESANAAKSEFLATMSHELRTPLNHIIGFTQLIIDRNAGDITPTQEEYLGDVLSSSRHLLSLINDILDLSKVEAGKMEAVMAEVLVPELLAIGMNMIREKALAHRIKLSIDTEGAPKIIRADERKLKQILYNLLSNAVKFTPDGGTVSLTARRCGSKVPSEMGCIGEKDLSATVGDYMIISVADSGIGLKRSDLERIFQPFVQADSTASRKYQGTGLGLSLTRRLVELHHGTIWAESEGEGKGSTFHVILPLSDVPV